jgi:hypothetical protein
MTGAFGGHGDQVVTSEIVQPVVCFFVICPLTGSVGDGFTLTKVARVTRDTMFCHREG